MLDPGFVEHILETYGLPLTMLVVAGILIIRGVFVTGKSADSREAVFRSLYRQERADHEETKNRLDKALEAASEAAALATQYERLVRERLK